MFALMQRKSKEAYACVLRILLEELGEVEVESAMADYENSLRASIREELPETETSGCWFHFSQAVVRRAKKLNLWQPNDQAKMCVKMAAALPLLPNYLIVEGINLIPTGPLFSDI